MLSENLGVIIKYSLNFFQIYFLKITFSVLKSNANTAYTERYSGPCQTSMMELFFENYKRLLSVNYFATKLCHRSIEGPQ